MMGLIEHFRRPPWPVLLTVSAGGYVVLPLSSNGFLPTAVCGPAGDLLVEVTLTLSLNSPETLLSAWSAMLVAMMSPLVAAPIVHVHQSSLLRRRVRGVAAFVVGYGAIWLTMAIPLGLVALLADTILGSMAFPLSITTAVMWSASPAHRRLLNCAHRLRPISLFGLRADLDCVAFGIEHGLLCAATCCAWMLVPLLAGDWHFAAMLSTGIYLLAERLTLPRVAHWHTPEAMALALNLCARLLLLASKQRHG